MNNIWKTDDEKAISFLNKSVILGLSIKELKTLCGNYCYLIEKSNNNNVLYIPNEVTIPRKFNSRLEDEIVVLRGTLQVIGGSGILKADRLFCDLKLKELDLRKFDTHNCNSMRAMFMYAYIHKITFGENWDTSKVTNMNDMFKYMNNDEMVFKSSNESIDLDANSWNIELVTNMQDMFFSSTFKSLKIDKWKVRKDCCIKGIFDNLKVNELDLRGLNLKKTFDGYNFISNAEIETLIVNLDDYNNSKVRKRLLEIGKCGKMETIK